MKAAEFQVSAAMARVTQADAARYPSFRIGGALGLASVTLVASDPSERVGDLRVQESAIAEWNHRIAEPPQPSRSW